MKTRRAALLMLLLLVVVAAASWPQPCDAASGNRSICEFAMRAWCRCLQIGVCCRVLREQVRGAVREGEGAGERVPEVVRAVLRGVQLRAHGEWVDARRVPLLPRHAHRRPQEEAQVPLNPPHPSPSHRLPSTSSHFLVLEISY